MSDQLTCGLNVAGVSQDPARYLPGALVTGADIAVEVRLTDRVVRAAIALVTGKECRRLPPGVVAGLTLDEITVAIRRGSSPAACRRRLVATAAAKILPDASLADVPVLSELRGYEGAAMDWALALKAQVDDWRAGRIGRFDQIADRAVCFASGPGLGKTTLARSVAKTLGLPIFETSVASWFANAGAGYLGEIVQQAEAVWQRAAAFGGPVVVLLDELDGLPARSSMSSRNRDFWGPIIHSLLLSLDRVIRVTAKGGRPHQVRITPPIGELLDQAADVSGQRQEVWTWVSSRGADAGVRQPVNYGMFQKLWEAAIERAGVKGLTIHDLRRTAGERVYRATGDIAAVSRFLRHANIELTKRYYLHVTPDDVEERQLAMEWVRAKSLDQHASLPRLPRRLRRTSVH